MFPPTSLNHAGYGGGGNRTRVVLPQVWLSRAVYGDLSDTTAVLHVRSDSYESFSIGMGLGICLMGICAPIGAVLGLSAYLLMDWLA